MPDGSYTSPLAAELAGDVLERFLRYARVATQADPSSQTYPSSPGQLELARLLAGELRDIGLTEVELTEHGYVLGTLAGSDSAPTVGLLAHVDTSPDAPGDNVKPIVHRAWGGDPIVLPGDPHQVLDPGESAELAARVGHDIVTSDGTTLLGADDKAGIAEIVAAVAWLARRPEVAHAPVRVAFTVDEEIARGTDHFDLEQFGADVAYTLDGGGLGDLEIETFSARTVQIAIRGHSVHPGSAKGRLVSALKLAAGLVSSLPHDRLSPETTAGREGFVHPVRLHGGTEEATVTFIVRDHDEELLDQHVALLERLASDVAVHEPRARVTVEVTQSYRNMRHFLDDHPEVVAAAEEAMRRAGVEPRHTITRGGTDGARLSEQGLPTPNLFTGGQDYHSVREWASVQDMAAAAAMLVHLAQVWAEPGRAGVDLSSRGRTIRT